MKQLVDEMAVKMKALGYDINKVKEKDVQGLLDSSEALSKQRAKEEALKAFPKETHKFFGRPLTEKDFKEIDKLYPPKKDPFQGFTPKLVPKGKKKPPEEPEFASGGIAGELRLNRQGYDRGIGPVGERQYSPTKGKDWLQTMPKIDPYLRRLIEEYKKRKGLAKLLEV